MSEKPEKKIQSLLFQGFADEVETCARQKFKAELEEAENNFSSMVMAADDSNREDFGDGLPDDQIYEAEYTFKEAIKEAWQTFKDEVRDGVSIKNAASKFLSTVNEAGGSFEVETTNTVEDCCGYYEDEAQDLRDQITEPVRSAVDEYVEGVKRSFRRFYKTLLKLEAGVKEGESSAAQPAALDDKTSQEPEKELEAVTVEERKENPEDEDVSPTKRQKSNN